MRVNKLEEENFYKLSNLYTEILESFNMSNHKKIYDRFLNKEKIFSDDINFEKHILFNKFIKETGINKLDHIITKKTSQIVNFADVTDIFVNSDKLILHALSELNCEIYHINKLFNLKRDWNDWDVNNYLNTLEEINYYMENIVTQNKLIKELVKKLLDY